MCTHTHSHTHKAEGRAIRTQIEKINFVDPNSNPASPAAVTHAYTHTHACSTHILMLAIGLQAAPGFHLGLQMALITFTNPYPNAHPQRLLPTQLACPYQPSLYLARFHSHTISLALSLSAISLAFCRSFPLNLILSRTCVCT